MNARPFIDTNILVYAFTAGDDRRLRAEEIVASGGIVSVQVLNEFVNVARKKRRLPWDTILAELAVLNASLEVLPLLQETHRLALVIARLHELSFYDGLIVSSARLAGCSILYSEDMQGGQVIDGVTITNPFQTTQAPPRGRPTR